MRKNWFILMFVFLFLYFSVMVALATAEEDDEEEDHIETGHLIHHKNTKISAIDPTKGGGIVVSPFAIQADKVVFEYTKYDDLIFVPDDGVPSMVLVFDKGSIVSTLYIDSDAKELLEKDKNNDIEIVGMTSLKVRKSDIEPAEEADTGIYAVDVRDMGGERNVKTAIDGELMSGSKVIYPQVTGPSTATKGATVIIKESKDISFFEIRSINDFMLWLNLKFSMNLNNEEKTIFRNGILTTLEKTVEDNTVGIPAIKKLAAQATSKDTCVAVG